MATKPHVSHRREPLEGRARLVFERLGYSVTYDAEALKAERDDKVVRVVTAEDGSLPRAEVGTEAGSCADKYCLVTHAEEASTLKRKADSHLPPDADWAVIGLEAEGDGYFVA